MPAKTLIIVQHITIFDNRRTHWWCLCVLHPVFSGEILLEPLHTQQTWFVLVSIILIQLRLDVHFYAVGGKQH